MKFRVLSILLLFLAVTAGVAYAGPVERPGARKEIKPDIVPNMVIVKFKHQPNIPSGAVATGVSSVDRVLQRVMASRVEALVPSVSLKKSTQPEARSIARIVTIHYAAPVDPVTLAKEIAADPAVEYAEPMINFRPLYTPNDPRLAQQWAVTAMKMAEAWDITKGDSTIVIGYVDSGVNYTHEDLAQSIWINPGEWGINGELSNNGIDDDGNGYIDDWRGWDFIGNGTIQQPNPDNNPMDFNGHGTNGASIAAARTDNGLGIAGIGFHTKVLPIKVQDDAAAGGMAGYPGIVYAADMGCKVINCSWGANGFASKAMQDVVDYAYSKGALVVAGAGNSVIDNDVNPFLPSNLRGVLSVSSQEPDNSASNWAAYGSSVHVFAPGKDVLAARASFGYQTVTGTSFAGPMMSGLAALIFSQHPDWTPDQVMKQIRVTTEPFGATRNPDFYGRPNAEKALSMNQTLSDIPGVWVSSFTVTTAAGDYFSERGQTAQISVELTNALAPTSPNATVSFAVKDGSATIANPTQTLGAVATKGKKTINFSMTLNPDYRFTEAYIPVVLTITDGEYVDYEVIRVIVFLDEGWHTAVDLRYPYNSVDMPDRWTTWVSGNFTQNGVVQQDIALRTTDGGSTWMFAFGTGFPSPKGVYCIDGIDGDRALVGTGPADGNAEIYRTSDGGANWTGASVAAMTPFVNWIHMYDGNNGIYQGDPKNNVWGLGKTTNGGQTWTPIATPLSAPANEAGWNNSYDVVGDNVWFGTNNSRIYKSTDRGETWTSYATPSRHSLDISFRDANVGIARFGRNNDTGTDTLAVTTDGGVTWTILSSINGGFGSVFFERGGKRLWYLKDNNAFVSTDVGATWGVFPAPPGMDFVSDADMHTDGFLTVAFAAGIQIYKLEAPFEAVTSAGSASAVPTGLAIKQVYPNPATASAGITVQFTTPQPQAVTLALYDMNGRHLRTAVSATLDTGSHSARIATDGLSAGSYVVRLSTASASATTQVTLVR
jgi:hypothetical protein